MKKSGDAPGQSASELISQRIAELGDWRGETLKRMRQLIREADPDIVEEWKWMGTPVFSHDGIVCTGESYKKVVKLTFAKGASLKDPAGLFNSSLDGNVRRAIDITEGAPVDETALKALVREAVALNNAANNKPARKPSVKSAASKPSGKPSVKSAASNSPSKASVKSAASNSSKAGMKSAASNSSKAGVKSAASKPSSKASMKSAPSKSSKQPSAKSIATNRLKGGALK
jgi:hypothetical protein